MIRSFNIKISATVLKNRALPLAELGAVERMEFARPSKKKVVVLLLAAQRFCRCRCC